MEESKYHSYIQEGQKEGSGELRATQPHLNPCVDGGAIILRNYF